MTLFLKQSTAIDIRMGPFVDATDGVSPETGVTLAGADQAEVLKANGAATVAMAGAFNVVTGSDGWYDYTASTTDTNTLGEVVFVVQDSSVCLPVFTRATVVHADVYEAMFGSTPAFDAGGNVGVSSIGTGVITATSIATDAIGSAELATTAVNEIRDAVGNAALSSYTTEGSLGQTLQDLWDSKVSGHGTVATAANTTTRVYEDAVTRTTIISSATNGNVPPGSFSIYFLTGSNAGVCRQISGFDATNNYVDLPAALPNTPSAGDTYLMLVNPQVFVQQWYDSTAGPLVGSVGDVSGGSVPASMTAIAGDTSAPTTLRDLMNDGLFQGDPTSTGTTTTVVDTTLGTDDTNTYVGAVIKFTGGTLAGEQSVVTAYDGTDTLTIFPAVSAAPATGHTYILG